MKINNIETYQRKDNVFMKMFNLFKIQNKKGYLLINIMPKAYNKNIPSYQKIIY